MRRTTLIALLTCAATGAAQAEDVTPKAVGGQTYARHLAEAARQENPSVVAVTVRVFAPGATPSVVGVSPSTARSGPTASEPLRNVSGDVIGDVRMVVAPGAAHGDAARRAVAAYIAKRALSPKNLADPYPYDVHRRADTRAQKLVDETLRNHPELLVLAIHATPPGEATNIIIGSNIGRIGKAADEDDLRVIDKGAINLEVAEGGERFEVELPLNDVHGNRIGALGTVFAYKAGADKAALQARAIAIRDGIAANTPDAAALFQPHG